MTITNVDGPIVYVAEIDVVTPGGLTTLSETIGWAGAPWGALSLTPVPITSTTTVRASDIGYRSLDADSIGVVPYPPLLANAFQVDQSIALPPGDALTAGAWGSLVLENDDGRLDGLALSANGDRRPIRIFWGRKTWDDDRGIFLDPSYDTLTTLFTGLAMPWFLDEQHLTIPLSDAVYWLQAPILSEQYTGGGGYDGDAEIAGQTKPATRGTVYNVTPKLIDRVNNIYQYTNGPGTVVNLYEGGALTITAGVDVADLTSGSTTPGTYRTDNAQGCFQLGSSPAAGYAITCDVTGEFPAAGFKTVAADIAYYLMTEDMGLDTSFVDGTSFTVAASTYPYDAGVYYESGNSTDGVSAVSFVLASFGAKPASDLTGKIGCFALRALTGAATPTFEFNLQTLVDLVPVALPGSLSPPPYRVRVAYKHNYTQQTTSLNTATATAAQLQYVAVPDQFASSSSNAVLLAYAKPTDLPPFGGALTTEADAQDVADGVLALWNPNCRLYDATVPIQIGLEIPLGATGRVTFPPISDLKSGKRCQVVHRSFKSDDDQITFTLLVT